MDDKKFNPSAEGDTAWLDEILESSDYGEDILKQMQPLKETPSSTDDDLDKILQEVMSDNWDLTETILNAPPVSIYNEESADTSIDVFDDASAAIEDAVSEEDTDEYEYEDAYEDEQDDPDAPVRKVRPKRKNGYGLFGLPHLVSVLIHDFEIRHSVSDL